MTADTTSRADPSPAPDDPSGAPSDLVGHYRILRRLDQGGIAQVFVGERADGLFDHRVAIKRVSATLPEVAARDGFESERRALAKLSHRNIAQLFDGGVDADGFPFLIMELVEGLAIDRHAAEQDLSVREVVTLMAAVCDGVQHAHQNLIIHAGLNPANILVDRQSAPRIVDFGVARVLQEAAAGEMSPTPALSYASPQRIQGLAPTVQDDVYSLGALIHALLTGVTPDRSEAVPRVSDVLRAKGFPGKPQAWSRRRASQCAGGLDDIIVRACARDAADRYPSAIALAEDLRAWCDHRPLADRRHQAVYVFGKLLRRRRLAAVAITTVITGVLAAIAVSTTLYISAGRDRVQAEKRFSDVRDLSRYLIYEVSDRLEKTPHALAMRHDVADIAQGYLGQLAATPSAPIEVRRDVVESLIRLAALQAGRARSNLGHPAEAKANLDRADAILDGMAKAGPLVWEDQHRRIEINLLRASIAMNADQALAEAQRFQATAQDELSHLPPPGPSPELAVEAAMNAAQLASWQGAYADALGQASSALALIDGLPRDIRQTDDIQDFEMWARSIRGDAFYYLDRYPEAEAVYRDNVTRAGVWLAEQPDSMLARRHAILARWNLATTIMERDPAGALQELDAASALVPRLMEFEPADENAQRAESIVLVSRAEILAATGRLGEALAAIEKQAEARRKRYEANADRPEYARAYAVLLTTKGDLLADNKRMKDACLTYAEADRIFASLQSRNRVSGFDSSNGGLAQLQRAMKAHCSPGKS